MAKSHIPVGIDLGTTYSAIAYLDNEGRPCTITNSEGELTTPSVVYFDRDCVIVGTEANHAGETDIRRLARAAKRDMGGSRYRKKILDRHLPPEVIQSFVLKRLKEDAELKLGEITQAVVTVPAYFNEPRRKATQDAAELAGLEVIDIINEPTAAALAYGIQRGFLDEKGTSETLERVLVYDLGGGTFDATLMEINNSHFDAIATAGDVHLGGIDWDQRIFDFATNELETKHKLDFQTDKVFQERLLNQCLRAKKALSARGETAIRLEYNGQRYSIEFTRQQFEELTMDLLERTRLTTDRLLRDAKLKWSDLTKLLLVGGSSRMPMVLEMLERESGLIVDRSLSPDESVAHGAAIYAGILLKHGKTAGQGISVSNVNSHDLGVLGIDPKTREPRRRVVIPRNHRLPANATKKFQTSKDGQKKIVVQVVEGGTDEGMGATTIGKCVVTDLPAEIKQGTEVLVGFNYLSSGRLQVVAEIPSLKLSADSAIDRSEGMNPEEIATWKKKLASGVATLLDVPPVRAKAVASTGPANAGQPAKKVPPREKKEPSKEKVADKSAADKQPVVTKKPKSKPAAKKKTVDRKPVSAKHSTIDIETGFERKPDVEEVPVFEDDDLKTTEFEVGENSGIFAFDDDDPKVNAGQSILDFLDQAEEKQASASGSTLDEFLTDLDRE